MKKLYKILGSVLICFSVMFGSFTVFAASPTVQVSNYTNNSTFTYSDNTYYAQYRTIFINCSDVSSGTVVIDFSGMSSSYKTILNSYKWFSEGCRVSYNSSTYKLTVSLSGVQFCTIGAYYITTAYTGFNLSYSITNNLTIDTDGTDDYYDSVLEEFGTLEAYADDIASDVNNMYLILVDMLGDVDDINNAMSSVNTYLSSLNTAVSTLKTLATSTNSAVTTILTYLISVDDNVEDIYDSVTSAVTLLQSIYDLQSEDSITLEDIDSVINSLYTSTSSISSDTSDLVEDIQYIVDWIDETVTYLMNCNFSQNQQIISQLTSGNETLGDILEYLANIYTSNSSYYESVLSVLSTLSDIDDTLDTISWNTFCDDILGFTDDFSTYTTNTGSHSERYYVFDVSSSWNDIGSSIIRCRIPIGNFTCSDVGIYTYSSSLREVNEYYSYIDQSRTWLYIYFLVSPNYSNAPIYYQDLAIKCNPDADSFSCYYYNETANAPIIEYITSNDIEYWQLLQYFDQMKSNLEIISLLEDLNGFTDGSVDDSTFSSDDSTFDSTFNDYQDTTDSIFDTFEDSVSDLDLTDSSFSLSDSVLNGVSFLSSGITSFVSADTGISILFYLPLLLGVIMLFLGIRR